MGCCSSIKQYTDAVIQPKSQDTAYTCILVNQQNQSIHQMHSVDFQHFQDDRYIYFELDENNTEVAQKKIDEMCKKLLVNLIIEDYEINKI